ncbi:uncharacterized protein FIBRA_08234 [Fibroporia radiculosa]|uniref:F-box domain-containing protein n=1 Tax=Fibroporia radiculosa TaxID=599839 RepID=J4GGW0_9APHY|nr:uncharacterized protein FIBRA_08234 [Fibroporia radiculosa]CCM05993.1 predicted protein [Fibroporia radiculosa]
MSLFRALNDDILIYLLPHISPLDARQLAMTCRTAYAYAMPRFLSEVKLGSRIPACYGDIPSMITRFCKFMLSDIARWGPCLKALDLTALLVNSFSFAMSLATVLSYAFRLERLYLSPCEELFRAAPLLLDAVASLPRISDLTLAQAGSLTFGCMSRLTSRPTRICITSSSVSMGSSQSTLDILQHLPMSVADLRIQLDCIPECESIRAGTTGVWRSIRTLELTGPISDLSTLSQAFPNVSHLRLVRYKDALTTKMDLNESQASSCWTRIDRADIIATGMNAVPWIPIRRLHCFQLNQGWHSFLQAASPVALTCYDHDVLSTCALDCVKGLHGVKFLQYMIMYARDASQREQEFEVFLITKLSSLANIPLVGVALNFGTEPFTTSSCDKWFASLVGKILPHIVYVGLPSPHGRSWTYKDDCTIFVCQWYLIERNEGGCISAVAQLSADEGRRVHLALLEVTIE